MKNEILTSKIIEKVYGKSIQHYKDYLKVETQKVVTTLQKKQELENQEIQLETEHYTKLKSEGVSVYHLPYISPSTVWMELSLYERLLSNIDERSIMDININNYPLLDFKAKEIHNKFIDRMTDEIADKLIKGESIL